MTSTPTPKAAILIERRPLGRVAAISAKARSSGQMPPAMTGGGPASKVSAERSAIGIVTSETEFPSLYLSTLQLGKQHTRRLDPSSGGYSSKFGNSI